MVSPGILPNSNQVATSSAIQLPLGGLAMALRWLQTKVENTLRTKLTVTAFVSCQCPVRISNHVQGMACVASFTLGGGAVSGKPA